ncbi:MAG: ribose-5-phosphate isomerase RpiA [Acetobacteraceae bacterium]|nr:ribose-5-phosphate isomerase RpiA [Acetobacteraceae bacterium]
MTGQDALKRQSAEAAVAEVRDGMVLGLGTGSTAKIAVDLIGAKVAEGMHLIGIPTSEHTAAQARALGVPLGELGEHPEIDLTIDGADEVHTGTLDLIKGLGGALLREKIVAAASRRMVVIVDESKLVPELGRGARLPVEVVPFGWQATMRHLQRAGADAQLRRDEAGAPFRTDNGNHILDCAFAIPDPAGLQARLSMIPGVVETGLFVGLASRVIAGTASGPRILDRT